MVIVFETSPLISLYACIISASLSALIISTIPSASARSIFPFKKALFVNSPASAGLHPLSISSLITPFITVVPPCTWNSTTSSPVYDLGALQYTQNALSVKFLVVSLPRYILYGSIVLKLSSLDENTSSAIFFARGPLSLTIPTAPECPIGVAAATMVSIFTFLCLYVFLFLDSISITLLTMLCLVLYQSKCLIQVLESLLRAAICLHSTSATLSKVGRSSIVVIVVI